MIPKKKWGQNFLVDPNISRKIARMADLQPDDTVWEIGPGRGILTEAILASCGNLTSFEIDTELIGDLEAKFASYPHFRIVTGDILRVDWNQYLQAGTKVIANLPYQITSPFLFRLADNRSQIRCAVLMIQKEVADRILAQPSTKDYSILTVKLNLAFDPERLFNVEPHLFFPKPKVRSTVIRLTPRPDPPQIDDMRLMYRIIETCFHNRRKTLRNNLKLLVSAETMSVLEDAFDLSRRGETLAEEDFLRLYRFIAADR